MNNQDTTLASQIISTLKKIIFALIITNILTIGAFIWYISLPVEEISYEQSTEDIDNSDVKQNIGGDLFGEGKAESNIQTQGGSE